MTQAVIELEAKKASFVKRFLSEVNSEIEFDSMLSYLNFVLDNHAAEMPYYSKEELHARIQQSEEDICAGRIYTFEDVTSEMEAKYPWLCD